MRSSWGAQLSWAGTVPGGAPSSGGPGPQHGLAEVPRPQDGLALVPHLPLCSFIPGAFTECLP